MGSDNVSTLGQDPSRDITINDQGLMSTGPVP